jgi:hypothetical protein
MAKSFPSGGHQIPRVGVGVGKLRQPYPLPNEGRMPTNLIEAEPAVTATLKQGQAYVILSG